MAALAIPGAAGVVQPLVGPGIYPMLGSALWAPPWGSAGKASDGRSDAVNVSKNLFIRVQIWSDSSAAASVTIDERSSPSAPWFPVATLVNPVTAIGEYWSIPVTMWLSINVSSYASGIIFAIIETHV